MLILGISSLICGLVGLGREKRNLELANRCDTDEYISGEECEELFQDELAA